LKDYLPLILFLQAAGMLGADHWFGL